MQSRHVQRCPAAIGDGGVGVRALCQQLPCHISVATVGRSVERRPARLRQGRNARARCYQGLHLRCWRQTACVGSVQQ